MKKITLLCAMALSFVFTNEVIAQTLNQNASWPSVDWLLTGTYSAEVGALEADPTTTANFAFDDDDAGAASDDSIAAESPEIDLSAAFTAGETWLTISVDYVYRKFSVEEFLRIQYFDADTSLWENWEPESMPGNDTALTDDFCAGTPVSYTTVILDIAGFTALQQTNFRYRILFDDDPAGPAYEYGFCLNSPTITSATPPSCPDPSTLSATTVNTTDVSLEWVEVGSAMLWNIEIVDITAMGTQTMTPTYTGVSSPYVETMLTPGNAYEFYVQSDCAGSGTSNWVGPVAWTQPNLGDVCESAIIVAGLPYTTSDDTANYGDDYDGVPGTDCGSGFTYLGGDDVVYEYTATSDTSINVVLSAIGDTYVGVFAYNDCADIGVACTQGAVNGNAQDDLEFDLAVTNGETYYILVSSWPAPQSTTYTLTIAENSCTDATVAYSIIDDCANSGGFNILVDITNMGTSTSIDMNDDQGSATQSTGVAGMFTFGPYVNATDVVISITDNDDANCDQTSGVLTQAVCPPSNDACANAIVVIDGDSVSGTTTGATNVEGLVECALGGGSATTGCAGGTGTMNFGEGVWYVFTAGPDIAISVTTDNSPVPFDTEIQVFSGDCNALVCVGGDDDGGDNGALSTFCWESSATTGNTVDYYIYVDGHATNSGDFLLDVTVESTLSTTDFESQNAFTYFPNPVKDELTLKAINTIQNISVINMLGQVVLRTTPNTLESNLDMNTLNQGSYFVQVTINDITETIRVIKQ